VEAIDRRGEGGGGRQRRWRRGGYPREGGKSECGEKNRVGVRGELVYILSIG
jgi:hypothetical protein